MSRPHLAVRILAVGTALCALLAGCDDDDDDNDDDDASRTGEEADASQTRPECALLTMEEVSSAIGENKGPEPDYLYGGCAWISPDFDPETAFAPRVSVSIRTSSEFETLSSLDDAVPQDDFAPGAVWGALYRELWWPCGERRCLISVALQDAEPSRQASLRLGGLVKERL